jgi:hypothetical protein
MTTPRFAAKPQAAGEIICTVPFLLCFFRALCGSWFFPGLRPQQSLQKDGIHSSAKPDLAGDCNHGHAGAKLRRQSGVSVNIHSFQKEAMPFLRVGKQAPRFVAQKAAGTCVHADLQLGAGCATPAE